MLAFVDESGDTGFKLGRGSSPLFAVSMVVFADRGEAHRCDEHIAQLRSDLALRASHEFHFSHNAPWIRAAFLAATQPFAFDTHAVVLDKARVSADGLGAAAGDLYQMALNLLFDESAHRLQRAIVTLDATGGRGTQRRLAASLRQQLNASDRGSSHRVKFERSSGNNLLQLADYVVALAARRHAGERAGTDLYRRYLSSKETTWRVWP